MGPKSGSRLTGNEGGRLVVALLDFQGDVDLRRARRSAGIRSRRLQQEDKAQRLVKLLLEGDDTGGVVPREVLDVGGNAGRLKQGFIRLVW